VPQAKVIVSRIILFRNLSDYPSLLTQVNYFPIYSEDDKQAGTSKEKTTPEKNTPTATKSTSFYSFYQLCTELFNEPSYNAKTAIVKKFLNKGVYYLNVYVNSR
jgi:hypothetical protein